MQHHREGQSYRVSVYLFLEVGVNNEGYWRTAHMAIQVEDIINCLKVLDPECDYKLLFDHSGGMMERGKVDSMQRQ